MYGWRFNWLLLEKNRGNKMKSGNITLGGILIALTIIILYSASILPVSTISVLTMAFIYSYFWMICYFKILY